MRIEQYSSTVAGTSEIVSEIREENVHQNADHLSDREEFIITESQSTGRQQLFTHDELEIMVNTISLKKAFSASITHELKEKVWDEITEQVNASSSSIPKTKQQIKRK